MKEFGLCDHKFVASLESIISTQCETKQRLFVCKEQQQTDDDDDKKKS